MPRSGITGEIQVRLRRRVRGDCTMGETNHPVHPRPNPCLRGSRSPGSPAPAPHPGGWGPRACSQARAAWGAGPPASGATLPRAPNPARAPPGPQAPCPATSRVPEAARRTRQLTQLSATGGRSSAPRRARFRGAGRQAVSRAAAREASRGRREARFRSRRVYEGRVLNTVPRGSRTIPTVLRESGRQ